MTLVGLLLICLDYDISPINVTFNYGYKEVYAVFTDEDFLKLFPREPELDSFDSEEEYEAELIKWDKLMEDRPFISGECPNSIII
jgi:hypothetical protein